MSDLGEAIEIKNKPNYFTSMILGVWSLTAIIVFVPIIFASFFNRYIEIEFLFTVLVGLVFSFYVFNQAFWSLFGKSKIIFNENSIVISSKYNFLRKEKTILKEKLISIEYSKEEFFLPAYFWGFVSGNIFFRCYGRNYRVGKGLSGKESKQYVKKLNHILDKTIQD